MKNLKKITIYMFSVFLIVGSLLTVGINVVCSTEKYLLPGDAKKGWQSFFTKGCIKCHSVWGEGGTAGPNLGITPSKHLTEAELTAAMWNHAPAMWEKMLAKGIDFKAISQEEMADIFAFLYFIRYMDEPGNKENGKELLATKKCTNCHAIHGKGGRVGPELTKWGTYTNPILWAQMMWNHAPQMEEEMRNRGITWPIFGENEMVDIIVYVKSVSKSGDKIFISPGDSKDGKILFSKKGCSHCHSTETGSKKDGPNLGRDLRKKESFPRTITQVAGLMWNHSPEMWKEMKEKGMKRPELNPQEMADLIAYLFSLQYFDEQGNREKGEKVFKEKYCIKCHTVNGKGGLKGPDLKEWRRQVSPISMAQAMWNHGPSMLGEMKKMGFKWPKFEGNEIVDLMEYLRELANKTL
ncbi:MAG: hypothetical protein A3C43_04845 [Candidatus Schekmanbacteria bacterium RIFCSPHIGHO2_02_FULL_38_11]|uniref:Cytochrome c domain-containing protein n=1 Tax=Candidatus Schekmanbacteria bacterium RIFCSPLOWO2_12_FULL_38_15 TaxID=1817883 RepID=A0A1F7SNV4_9BACT|nr:MAG: hypothetical protein A2043_05260 [Candidatus Schekmanbacteria bacterium GWA2_38_9]OGL48509.1 MAG: hypothetical protein A3C43_04845 [Candidatus Schekmanbacteria bacterium RIFCSPHIGHO2_02_FULL_38_11]OGL50246.1 MAG: hypothetical protein A3H37_00640 [Candidatus Schekmanbacteria bacterium RIFCSPLOWO2_02_FULL_38_14]OGL55443.1 MAG: hypothetical protein A3G31_01360 [Candidatus Schekmanbacteria bacterium RIFCSPLOWO2_12_FULL_38_15]